MAQYKTKFCDIDPETCSMKELEDKIDEMHNLSGYFETKQLALKIFINSIYGACASKYFVAHNTEVAESITLQGQDLNHYSENSVNKYFRGVFQSEEHYHKTIYVPIYEYMEKYSLNDINTFCTKDKDGNWLDINIDQNMKDMITNNTLDEDKKDSIKKKIFVKTEFGPYLGITYEQAKNIDLNLGRVTDQKPLSDKEFAKSFKYLGKTTYLEDNPNASMTVAGDTDSTCSLSTIYVNQDKIMIKDAFTKCKYENHDMVLKLQNGQEIVPVHNHTTKAYDDKLKEVVDRQIKYIMRHKVSKAKFKIKSKSGKEVIVTGDHSCMVIRDNKLIEVKAKDINSKTDKLVEISDK